MAPSLLAAVSASPFLLPGSSGISRRPLGAAPTRRAGLRVAALKYDPAKVAPQNDRVLVRLQQIPEVSPLSTAFHYCTFVLLFCFI
uniref:Uncharacterized protein n=1 Tax=Zea mays TaxID=4577 RepID=B4G049_MAIZE|nr:unknown [Zea mays]ACG29869.1 hypothetical protein [Zea mays]